MLFTKKENSIILNSRPADEIECIYLSYPPFFELSVIKTHVEAME